MGAGVEVWTEQDSARLGASLAVPSSWDTVDPWGIPKQDTQPCSSPGRLLGPLS